MLVVRRSERESFTAPDGSTVRELVQVESGAANQSLAEAKVAPGAATTEHYHRASEEIYHFLSGAGRVRLGDEEADVAAGDTVLIAPGVSHKLWNLGDEPLVLLCCSSPPYRDEDTVLCE